jgi:hypothetical protein
MPIRSLTLPGAFEPEMIAVMSEAFEAVCKELSNAGQQAARDVIALRIITAATLGERDPVRLRESALPRERD